MITYIKSAFCGLMRNKFFTIINLICMIIGLTCSTLLFLYVKNEFNKNLFFKNHERVVRIESNWSSRLSLKQTGLLKSNLPEIEKITFYEASWSGQDLVNYNQTNYNISNVIYADSLFFDVFQFKSYYGNLKTALNAPYSMVLTKWQANQIFGNINPVGKTVSLKTTEFGIYPYTVTAVIDDLPNNCSFKFNMVLSYSGLLNINWYKNNAEHWGTCNTTVFALLSQNANTSLMAEKAKSAVLSQAPQWVHDIVPFKFNYLDKLHFGTASSDGVFINGKLFTVRILGAIGFLILLVAGVNFVNLTRAQVETNNKQWVIRRTIGANRLQIIMHWLASSGIIILIGVVASIVLIYYLLPVFNNFTSSNFSFSNIITQNNIVMLSLLMLFIFVFFCIIPAVINSNRPLLEGIKGGSFGLKQSRKYSLIAFQFAISIILLIGAVFIYRQNQFMMSHDDGFTKQNIVYINQNPESDLKAEYLEQEFEKVTGVTGVAFASGVLGSFGENWGRDLYHNGQTINVDFDLLNVSYDFIDLFNLQIVDGKKFTKESEQRNDIIFNQKSLNKFNLESIIGASLSTDKSLNNVIGVVKDIYQKSLHEPVDALALRCTGDKGNIMYVRFDNLPPAKVQLALQQFESKWNEVSQNFPFNYQFLDSHYQYIYDSENKLMKLVVMAALLSIVMAVLGLIALVSFMINSRTKEIGIRKVNGAKIWEILLLVNTDFVKWVVFAFIFSTPVAYFATNNWLQNFAYRTSLSWWVFVLAGLVAVLVTIITVSVNSFKTTVRNPVDALRYE